MIWDSELSILNELIITAFLLAGGINDLRKKSLYRGFLVIGGFTVVISSFILSSLTWQQHLAGIILGGILLIIAKLSNGQIGFGDGIVVCIIGFALGFERNIIVFLYAITLTALTAGILLAFKRINRRSKLPFIPFIFTGYLISLL